MHDLEDQLKLDIGCESHASTDSTMLVQFNNEGSEVRCHLDGLESKEDAVGMIEMPNSFKAEDFFTADNYWPPASQDVFIKIIFRAIIDHTQKSGFDHLSNAEMYFHLLPTIIHYYSSRTESVNICSMLEHTSLDSDELLKSIREGRFSVLARYFILEAPCITVLAVITSSLACHFILH
jgi:hypothetical protein